MYLNMERKIIRAPKEEQQLRVPLGARGNPKSQKINFTMDLSMESKMLRIQRENQDIRVSVGPRGNPNSQEMSLGRTSSWRVTC